VVRAVYDAAGEGLPTAESFKVSDLGESEGSEEAESAQAGLRALLAQSVREKDNMERLSSLDSLHSVLRSAVPEAKLEAPAVPVQQRKKMRRAPVVLPHAAAHVLSDKQLWQRAMAKAQATPAFDLDHSKEFVPGAMVELELAERGHAVSMDAKAKPPTLSEVKSSLRKDRRAEEKDKRKMRQDMRVAEITENSGDLVKGMKDEKQLKRDTDKVRDDKREERRLVSEKQGRETVQQAETRDLEERVMARVKREHVKRLKYALKDTKKRAFAAKMVSAKTAANADRKRATTKMMQAADAKASLAMGAEKVAEEAYKAALGDNKSSKSAVQPSKSAISSDNLTPAEAKKIAEEKNLRAQTEMQDAIDNGSQGEMKSARQAANIALAYGKTAQKIAKRKMLHARQELQKASNDADEAMAAAIQSGTADSFAALRKAMGARRNAVGKVEDMDDRRKLKTRMAKLGLGGDKTVMMAEEQKRAADAKYYADAKLAERRYGEALEVDGTKAVNKVEKKAVLLVTRENESSAAQDKASLQLAAVRTQAAAKNVEEAKAAAQEAIQREHDAERSYQRARRYAMSSIGAKDSSKLKEESTDEKFRDFDEKYNDWQTDQVTDGNKYQAIKQRMMQARSNMIMTKSAAKQSKERLIQMRKNMGSMRKKASALVKGQLARLDEEVKILQASGNKKAAKAAVDNSNVRQQKRFLKREERRELQSRVTAVKEEATSDLALEMTRVVEQETDKLHKDINEAAANDDIRIKTELHNIKKKAEKKVKKKMDGILATPLGKKDTKKVGVTGLQKQDKLTKAPALEKVLEMAKKLKDGQVSAAKAKKQAEKVKAGAGAAVKKLKDRQKTPPSGENPLKEAEDELKKIKKVEKVEMKKLKDSQLLNTDRKEMLEEKYRKANTNLRTVQKSLDSIDPNDSASVKQEAAKMKAAKAKVQKAKLAKIRNEKKATEAKMKKVQDAVNVKKSAIKQATDSAESVLEDLRKGAVQATKAKIMEAKIRQDRWAMQGIKDKSHEAQLNAEDAVSIFHDLAERTEDRLARYNKAKSRVRSSRDRLHRVREAAHAARRHYKTTVKIAAVSDRRYREAKDEVATATMVAKQKENFLHEQQKDFKVEEVAKAKVVKETTADADGA